MSFFSAALQAYRVSRTTEAAVEAALMALEAGRGPLGAVDAFAAAAGVGFTTEMAAELKAGIVEVIAVLEASSHVVVQAAEALDAAQGTVISLGLRGAALKAVLRHWLEVA